MVYWSVYANVERHSKLSKEGSSALMGIGRHFGRLGLACEVALCPIRNLSVPGIDTCYSKVFFPLGEDKKRHVEVVCRRRAEKPWKRATSLRKASHRPGPLWEMWKQQRPASGTPSQAQLASTQQGVFGRVLPQFMASLPFNCEGLSCSNCNASLQDGACRDSRNMETMFAWPAEK